MVKCGMFWKSTKHSGIYAEGLPRERNTGIMRNRKPITRAEPGGSARVVYFAEKMAAGDNAGVEDEDTPGERIFTIGLPYAAKGGYAAHRKIRSVFLDCRGKSVRSRGKSEISHRLHKIWKPKWKKSDF